MAKTKKTIRKIIWDTERGVGVAREYTPRVSFFSLNERDQVTENDKGAPCRDKGHPCIVEVPARDPKEFSPHVLDLRHMHTAMAGVPMSPPSFISRFFSVWKKRKRALPDHMVAPLASGSSPRLPAIHAHDIAEHFSPRGRAWGEGDWNDLDPAMLIQKYVFLSELSIGIPLLLLAHCCIVLRPIASFLFASLFSLVAWIGRPLHLLRVFASTFRYAIRRMRIEWDSLAMPRATSLAVAPVLVSPALPRKTHRRTLSVFIILALVLSIPFHAFSSYQPIIPNVHNVQQKGIATFAHANTALALMKQGAWRDAQNEWAALKQGSQALASSLYLTNPLIGGLGSIFSSRIRTGRAIVTVATAFADAGNAAAMMGEIAARDSTLSDRLVRIEPLFNDFASAIDRIDASMPSIDVAYLPSELREHVARIPPLLDEAKGMIRRIEGIIGVLPALLGHDHPMRYLVLFQNDAEARPTGGFIGSIGIVDIEKGNVRKIYMPTGGSYDVQGALRVNYRSPEPLQYVNPRFEFHDANWWPDFPTSARKLLALWDNAQEPTVDGVIAVNASFFERLLTIVGPVEMPAYGKRIDAENFFFETQKAVELEYDRKANTPKKFLRDLATVVIEKLGVSGNAALLPIALAFLDAIPERDIQAYLIDPALQQKVVGARLSGAFMPLAPSEDALRIVRTNIGGGKTDHVVRDTVTHTTTIADDGSIEDQVTITRVHNGKRGALFQGARSRDFLRVYVPKGATLIRADGFSLPTRAREIPPEEYRDDPDLAYFRTGAIDPEQRVQVTTEGDRTFFGGWVEVNPGEIKTIALTYRLPFSFTKERVATYRLRLEKQSGIRGMTIMHRTIASQNIVLQEDTLPALANPIPLKYDMTLLQTFR